MAADKTTPEFKSLVPSNPAIDLTNGDVVLQIAADVFDADSGIYYWDSTWQNVQSLQSFNVGADSLQFPVNKVTSKAQRQLGQYTSTGDWTLQYLNATDAVGNQWNLSLDQSDPQLYQIWVNNTFKGQITRGEVEQRNIKTQFTVSNSNTLIGDATAPEFQGLALTNTSIDLTNGDVVLQIAADVFDADSGIYYWDSTWQNVQSLQSFNVGADSLQFPVNKVTSKAQRQLGQYTSTGDWTLQYLNATDAVGNQWNLSLDQSDPQLYQIWVNNTFKGQITRGQVEQRNIKTQFTVSNSNTLIGDATAPEFQGLALTNTSIDLTNGDVVLQIAADVFDADSGIYYWDSTWQNVQSLQSFNVGADSLQFPVNKVTSKAQRQLGQYTSTGDWTLQYLNATDAVGNQWNLSLDQSDPQLYQIWVNNTYKGQTTRSDVETQMKIKTSFTVSNNSIGIPISNTSDTSEPKVDQLVVNTPSVDITNGNGFFSLQVDIQDNRSGIESWEASWISPSGHGIWLESSGIRTANTPLLNASLVGESSVSQYAEVGTWSLDLLRTRDVAGNYWRLEYNKTTGNYDATSGSASPVSYSRSYVETTLGIKTTFNVVGPNGLTDLEAPKIDQLVVNTPSVDITNGNGFFSLQVDIQDNRSGIESWEASWISPSGQGIGLESSGIRTANTPLLTASLVGESSVSQYAEVGTWSLDLLTTRDVAGNYWRLEYNKSTDKYDATSGSNNPLSYSRSYVETSLGIKTTFDVVGPNGLTDLVAPKIDQLVVNTPSVDITSGNGFFSLQADIQDNRSGIESWEASWISPSGHGIWLESSGIRTANTPLLNASLVGESSVSQYAEVGTWSLDLLTTRDVAGNYWRLEYNKTTGNYDATSGSASPVSYSRSYVETTLGIKTTFNVLRSNITPTPTPVFLNQQPISTANEVKSPQPTEVAQPEPESPKSSSILGIQTEEKVKEVVLPKPLEIGGQQIDKGVIGTDGRDKITGSEEGEVIAGGKERDQLVGNGGPDAFVFETPDQFGKKVADVIEDFKRSEDDRVGVTRDAFPGLNRVTLARVQGGREARQASETSKTFIYDSNKGFLYYNSDGRSRGFGEGGIFAILKDAPPIGRGDIVLI